MAVARTRDLLPAGERAALEALFDQIAATRMRGLPIVHPALGVHALGFRAEADGSTAVGVLITPWFMNLLRLPLDGRAGMAGVGVKCTRAVGNERFEFIGTFEADFGAYEACSLFSPMFEFVDDQAALATAQAVLQTLRQPGPALPAALTSRRALLFGHGPEVRP